jgi:hypothetical protein
MQCHATKCTIFGVTSLSGGTWTPPQRISTFDTGTGPALAAFAGRPHLVWKGVADDYSVFMANFDGFFRRGQHQVPNVASGSTHPRRIRPGVLNARRTNRHARVRLACTKGVT